MSALILKNIMYMKTCYRYTNILKITKNSFVANNCKLLLQAQAITDHHALRTVSSKSLAMKQYKSSRRYTMIWKSERFVGWSLIVLIPMGFATESNALEMVLSTVALLHTYWGCQSMCSDYLRSSVVGKLLPIIIRLSITLICITSLVGAHELIYKDMGLMNTIKKIWSIRGRDYMSRKKLQRIEKPKNIFNMFFRK